LNEVGAKGLLGDAVRNDEPPLLW